MNTVMDTASDTSIANWDAYAGSFSSVMPEQMLKLNREVASFMQGDVADFGCGGGKIIPFLLTREAVTSYTGIDASAQMIANARWVADQYQREKVTLVHGRIEDTALMRMDAALSINSYYVWDDPLQVLGHIHGCLKEGARLVLATINPDINMPALLEEARKELIAHPHWAEFREHNLQISESTRARFVDMDTLISQLRSSGFRVEEAHSRLYGGGLNLVVCTRSAR